MEAANVGVSCITDKTEPKTFAKTAGLAKITLFATTVHGLILALLQHQLTTMATIQLTAEGFKENIFDYSAEEEWKYKGKLPAIVDFYADWCGPCKAVAPVLEMLSEEYKDQLLIYKIDTDKEQELSTLFGIQSIPTFLFIPLTGAPMLQKGAIPMTTFKQVIEERLLHQSTTS